MAESTAETALPALDTLARSNARKTRTLFADTSRGKRIRLDPQTDTDLNKESLSLRFHAEYTDVQTLPEPLAAKQAAAAGARKKAGGGKKQAAEEATAGEASARKTIEDIADGSPSNTRLGQQTNALVHVRRPAASQNGARNPGQQLVRAQDVHSAPRPDWHPPWKLMRVISGHLGWVRALAVEPGNKWFASGAGDRTIKIWDMASGSLRLTLTGHISTVRGLAVSPRHPYLFSCGEDKM